MFLLNGVYKSIYLAVKASEFLCFEVTVSSPCLTCEPRSDEWGNVWYQQARLLSLRADVY